MWEVHQGGKGPVVSFKKKKKKPYPLVFKIMDINWCYWLHPQMWMTLN